MLMSSQRAPGISCRYTSALNTVLNKTAPHNHNMSRYVFLITILLPIFLQYGGLGIAAPAPAPEPDPFFNSFLSLFNPSAVTNGTSALNALALSHINHQLSALSSLGTILGGGGFNFTDSMFG
ncbi:unnamed protein product [Arctia plantaginis]|uniref:Uncharacterized protein n=1 Tax=Arctia plantaginis TaxID=874455 RepID=A0A8S1A5M3_ARCPL|nr:unnamed protein product [Arctia plantaginis]